MDIQIYGQLVPSKKMWDQAISTFFKDGVARFSEAQVEPFEDFLYNKIPLVLRSTPPIGATEADASV
jgi:hypothetical protein